MYRANSVAAAAIQQAQAMVSEIHSMYCIDMYSHYIQNMGPSSWQSKQQQHYVQVQCHHSLAISVHVYPLGVTV